MKFFMPPISTKIKMSKAKITLLESIATYNVKFTR